MTSLFDEKLSVAPMMDWTDRHFRYFARTMTKHTVLYSEMITANAVVFGDAERLLDFSAAEKPVVLQLGGSDPDLLGKACAKAASFDYTAVNLNAGCPSERVAAGAFGAVLMKSPQKTADCLQAMIENAKKPVTLKTRIAIEEETPDTDGYDALCHFVDAAAHTGVSRIIVHARKARLTRYTPKQNRDRPTLRYDLVYRLKRDFPEIDVIINGNITDWTAAKTHLEHVDGVMVGRAAYASPYLLATADKDVFEDNAPVKSRFEIIDDMLPYIDAQMTRGVPLHAVTRHMLNLFKTVSGAALWRRQLTENVNLPTADAKTVAKIRDMVISSCQL